MYKTRILEAPRNVKRLLMLVSDLLLIPVAVFTSYLLVNDFELTFIDLPVFFSMLLTSLASAYLFMKMGLYLAAVRFMGHEAVLALIKGVSFSTVLFVLSSLIVQSNLSLSLPIIFWGVSMGFVGGARFLVRELVNRGQRKQKKSVAIYGAGQTGMQLLSSLHNGNQYEPVALLDDNKALWGTVFQGVTVSSPEMLNNLIEQRGIEQVLLAMPRIASWRKKEMLKTLELLPVRVKTVPSVEQLVNGDARIEQVRDIEIEELLGRDAVEPNNELLEANISDKNVLVTGAGGSIGAELCRQILQLQPRRLLLFERCEFALYEIEKELKDSIKKVGLGVELVPLIGCVQDVDRVESVLDAFDVHTVYHAAAYKHVPIVEQNVIEGVRNNVFGTYVCAKAATKKQVETFVLISTDKAVRPTNIMGASKRMAELILQGLSKQSKRTRFSMVRFGNVLGSSGSVVPLFKKQIKSGGPITVTHPEIIRYFMTIPEAAQLVIQAGAMAKGGDVFVLDMGEPVRIADLARTMVRLMGLEVNEGEDQLGDIEIKYTGLRPGEKLFEELLIGENAHGTAHPRIMRAHEVSLPWDKLEVVMRELATACDDKDCEAIRELLLNSETGYIPSEKVNDLVWQKANVAQNNVLRMDRGAIQENAI